MNATIDLTDRPAGVPTLPFLAADVGGTYARVALVQVSAEREIELLAYRKLACADFPGLPQLLESFWRVLANAGTGHDGTTQLSHASNP